VHLQKTFNYNVEIRVPINEIEKKIVRPLVAFQSSASLEGAIMYDNCSAETGGLKRNSATIEDNQKKKARPLAAFQSAPSPSPYGNI
jgi:hypothetical protein